MKRIAAVLASCLAATPAGAALPHTPSAQPVPVAHEFQACVAQTPTAIAVYMTPRRADQRDHEALRSAFQQQVRTLEAVIVRSVANGGDDETRARLVELARTIRADATSRRGETVGFSFRFEVATYPGRCGGPRRALV